MEWSKVTEQHDKIIIIGGGESLAGFDFEQLREFKGAIITVNNVIFHLPRADYWMTVDPMAQGEPQRGMRVRRNETKYYCAYPDLEKAPWDKIYYTEVPGINFLERVLPNIEAGEDYKLQEDKGKITTGDSVYGALGLAYHMRPEKIVLLGVDGYGYGHWYNKQEPYNKENQANFQENHLDNLPGIYKQSVEQLAKAGIITVNGSRRSIIDCFKRATPQQAINWIINDDEISC